MPISSTVQNGVTVVVVTGEFRGASKKMEDVLFGGQPLPRALIVDLEGVSMVDSVGMRVIIEWNSKVTKAGGDLKLVSPGPSSPFADQISKLLSGIPSFDTREAALAAF